MAESALKTWQRGVPFEVKAIDDTARTFEGVAAAYSRDLGDDVIEPGAFKTTIHHWRGAKAKRPVYLLNGHNAWDVQDVVGKMIEAEETDAGLETKWEFVPAGDPAADAAYARVKGGFITGMSIGYTPLQFEYRKGEDGKTVRHLKEVKLHEVSLVVFPMNEDARIDAASVKSWLEGPLTEEAKDFLRQLPEDQKQAIRALVEPDIPVPPAASEALIKSFQDRMLRLKLRRLTTRAMLGSAISGPIHTATEDTTHAEDRGAA